MINIVQRAIIFIGNAHVMYLTDRRKGLLRRILSDCVNLVVDSICLESFAEIKRILNCLVRNLRKY